MKLLIDGVAYAFPRVDELTMGEARLVKRYSGLTLDKIASASEGDPDLMAAFIHIALARATPSVSSEEIEKRVDAVKLATVDTQKEPGDAEDDARPPALTGIPAAQPAETKPTGAPSNGASDGSPVTPLVSTGPPT